MIAQKEVSYAKEIDDVLVLVVELVKDIKAKKGVSEIASENIANLMAALSGIDQANEEMKNKAVVLQTIGYRLGDLAAALVE